MVIHFSLLQIESMEVHAMPRHFVKINVVKKLMFFLYLKKIIKNLAVIIYCVIKKQSFYGKKYIQKFSLLSRVVRRMNI